MHFFGKKRKCLKIPQFSFQHTNPPEHINFNVDQIMKSFPKSTAAGPSGLRIDHIKEALSLDKNPNSDFSNLLKNFINYLISGSVPSELKYYIGGARLIALEKPNKDLRPIAIGESFRRIASKVMCQACQSDIQDYFSNIQHGNQKRGCETIVHKIKSEIESLKNWCLLKVDIINAFNSVKRKSFLDQMAKVFPKEYNWSKWLYEEKTPLQLAKFIIWSETGVQQGDPLGPLLFCAAIHPILEQIHRECGLDINAWYMDDGNLLGDPDKLLKAWEILSTELPKIGLELGSKCEWITSSDIKGPESVKITPKDELIILGVPLGSKEFCLSYLDKIIKEN